MRQAGIVPFAIVWSGQTVSAIGDGICWFAITLWAWRESGSPTVFGLLLAANLLPGLLLGPIVGVYVDRLRARTVMLLCDGLLALVSLLLLVALAAESLRIWGVAAAGVAMGLLSTCHWLGYSKTVAELAGPDRLGRANALVGLTDPLATVAGPLFGGLLFAAAGLTGALILDVATFAVAVVALVAGSARAPSWWGAATAPTRPRVRGAPDPGARRRRWWRDLAAGLAVVRRRRRLRVLLATFFGVNLVISVASVLTLPLIMIRTGNDATVVGLVIAASGVGGIVGGLCALAFLHRLSPTLLIFGGIILGCLGGPFLTSVARSEPWWLLAAFCAAFVLPVVNGAHQTLWQRDVPLPMQGRVFGVRRTITQAAVPLGLVSAGPLVELLEPATAASAPLRAIFGAGSGGATALVLGTAALLTAAIGVAGWLSTSIQLDRRDVPCGSAAN